MRRMDSETLHVVVVSEQFDSIYQPAGKVPRRKRRRRRESSRVSLFHWPNGGKKVRTDGKVPFGKAAKRVRSIKKGSSYFLAASGASQG